MNKQEGSLTKTDEHKYMYKYKKTMKPKSISIDDLKRAYHYLKHISVI